MKASNHSAKPAADIPERRARRAPSQPDKFPAREPPRLPPELLNSFRTGIGNDLHRLIPGRKLILGGVRVPFAKGPASHSDGDALVHAICDALLGAAALGDIGRHFPNTSPQWRAVSSLVFLHHVRKLLQDAGYAIVNVDATIGLERPKLSPYIPRMRAKLAEALGLDTGQVSVKAKTGEGVDALGHGEAVRADAVALICKKRVEKSRS
jgi:2-C-methyl-D-erythritol 2,4-cyclodiphosphate synthase